MEDVTDILAIQKRKVPPLGLSSGKRHATQALKIGFYILCWYYFEH